MTWMYHKTTGEAKLFKDESEITNEWCDTPEKCTVEEAEVVNEPATLEAPKRGRKPKE